MPCIASMNVLNRQQMGLVGCHVLPVCVCLMQNIQPSDSRPDLPFLAFPAGSPGSADSPPLQASHLPPPEGSACACCSCGATSGRYQDCRRRQSAHRCADGHLCTRVPAVGAMWRMLYACGCAPSHGLHIPTMVPCHKGAQAAQGRRVRCWRCLARCLPAPQDTLNRAVLLPCAGGHHNFASLSQYATPLW